MASINCRWMPTPTIDAVAKKAIEFEGDDRLDYMRDGGTLVMTRLDHLAGSTLDLRATGRLLFHLLGAIGAV